MGAIRNIQTYNVEKIVLQKNELFRLKKHIWVVLKTEVPSMSFYPGFIQLDKLGCQKSGSYTGIQLHMLVNIHFRYYYPAECKVVGGCYLKICIKVTVNILEQ